NDRQRGDRLCLGHEGRLQRFCPSLPQQPYPTKDCTVSRLGNYRQKLSLPCFFNGCVLNISSCDSQFSSGMSLVVGDSVFLLHGYLIVTTTRFVCRKFL